MAAAGGGAGGAGGSVASAVEAAAAARAALSDAEVAALMEASAKYGKASDPHKFDPDALLVHFKVCALHPRDIPLHAFVLGCDEVKKIVCAYACAVAVSSACGGGGLTALCGGLRPAIPNDRPPPTTRPPPNTHPPADTLGSAFAIASADITEKTGILGVRAGEMEALAAKNGSAIPHRGDSDPPAGDKPVRMTLQFLVDHEMRTGMHTHVDEPYVSAARSLLRLMWFLDFLSVLIRLLLDDKVELGECAQSAYDEALAKHHPWLLRKTIGAAIYFLPYKATFWRNLAGTDDDSFIRPKLQAFVAEMDVARLALWAYYGKHKLEGLP